MLLAPVKHGAPAKSPLRRSGAAAVEFAVVCLPLFAVIMAALELGRAMMVLQGMSNAARTACRYGVCLPPPSDGTNLTDIQSQATTQLAKQVMVYSSTVNVYYYTPSSGTYTAPSTSSTWNSYPTTSQSSPAHPQSSQGDYLRVQVVVNAKDVTWVPFYWFLGASQSFKVNEDMAMEY